MCGGRSHAFGTPSACGRESKSTIQPKTSCRTEGFSTWIRAPIKGISLGSPSK